MPPLCRSGAGRCSGRKGVDRSYRVLFVCMGNICRSPAAECLFGQMVREAGLEERIQCDSAGTIRMHQGQPPDPRMARAGAARGIRIGGRARGVARRDFERFDLLLAMDRENHAFLRSLAGERRERVRLFCEFVEGDPEGEVPDPYYGRSDGFERVLDLLEEGCRGLLSHIRARL